MSLSALPEFPLCGDAGDAPSAELSARFAALGIATFRGAAAFVRALPYARTSVPDDYRLVLAERRGTCSSKHALLARLAAESGQPVELVLGLYPMDGRNTPGTGDVLAAHGLDHVPEAHCYLRHEGARVDVTRAAAGEGEAAGPLDCILHEEVIAPEQIGAFKIEWHRRQIRRWIECGAAPHGLTLDAIWAIREACIAAIARADAAAR